MSNLLSITDVGIEIPKKSIELLQSVEETCYPEEYERILTTLIVEESQRLIGREALIEKPDIQIGKLCLINYINCTDTATVQSLLCEQAGIDSYIAFSGNHASTIVFFNDHYWHLQGESTVEIKNSEKRSADVDDDKVATVKGALSEIKHNDGVYI